MLRIILDNTLKNNLNKLNYTHTLKSEPNLNLNTPSMYFSQYEHSSKLVLSSIQSTHNNLINTILAAYNGHIPVRFRPNDFQMAIQMIIATCIANNAKSMRDLFVPHEGRVKLRVHSSQFDLDYFTNQFKLMMEENILDPEFIEKFTTSFTTTTPLLSTVSNMFLMNALKEYFSFEMFLDCGIPSVILEGTQEDWLKLKAFYDYFKTFLKDTELKVWFPHFDTIMDMFIRMRSLQDDGEIEAPPDVKEMFKRIISFVPQGSGADTILGGWARLFVPYSDKNKLIGFDKKIQCLDITIPIPNIDPDCCTYREQELLKEYYFASGWNSMQTSYLTTPSELTVNTIGGDLTYNVELFAGFFNPVINEDLSVSTNVGFIMRECSTLLKQKLKDEYLKMGVCMRIKNPGLIIPITLKGEIDKILSTFDVCSYNWYVLHKEKRIQYYLENGVKPTTYESKNKAGKILDTLKILDIPEKFKSNLDEIFLCFDINYYSQSKCTYY